MSTKWVDSENRTENDKEWQRLLTEVWNQMTTFMYNIHIYSGIPCVVFGGGDIVRL